MPTLIKNYDVRVERAPLVFMFALDVTAECCRSIADKITALIATCISTVSRFRSLWRLLFPAPCRGPTYNAILLTEIVPIKVQYVMMLLIGVNQEPVLRARPFAPQLAAGRKKYSLPQREALPSSEYTPTPKYFSHSHLII